MITSSRKELTSKKASDGARGAQRAGPCTVVIFGAAGDLTKRKLVPALYNLAAQGLLPAEFGLVGFARKPLSSQAFRESMRADIRAYATNGLDEKLWSGLEPRLDYVAGSFDDPKAYAELAARLGAIEKERGTKGNLLFYLATAPDAFATISKQLRDAGLTQESAGNWRRVIVEKPFGRDLDSAKALNRELMSVLDERQIYRIDHYLGKETVQNILVFRLANGIFEHLWNSRYIDHVQMTVSETLGVEDRGNYYDNSGALRDMVPNHIFQLVSLIGMEPPAGFDAEAVRDEQAKVLRAIQVYSPEEVIANTVRGQYGPGTAAGRALKAYRAEPKVSPTSNTETFVAMKLKIDNWRWNGVPFYLRVGKALAKRKTEIVIQFKEPPFHVFRDTSVSQLEPNRLVIDVQPDEGITLHFGAKVPGATVQLSEVTMNFRYSEHFQKTGATGYERLLYDAMCGDATLFQRADMVEAAWRVVNPMLDVWTALPAREFPNYAAGTDGPDAAADLLARDGRAWRPVEA